jgi:hypothetical protein
MIIKRNMAIDSLTKVCEESLALIKQLIDADNETYGQGYEDGMAAQAKVQQTLRPWVGLTPEEKSGQRPLGNGLLFNSAEAQVWEMAVEWAETKLKEKNNA